MKRVIVSFQAKLADVYDDSSFPDPTAERIEKRLFGILGVACLIKAELLYMVLK